MPLDFGLNAGLVEELHARWTENPAAVDASWRAYFERNGSSPAAVAAPSPAPTPAAPRTLAAPAPPQTGLRTAAPELPAAFAVSAVGAPTGSAPVPTVADAARARSLYMQAIGPGRVHQLVTAYRFVGHLGAHLDPLGEHPPLPRELDHRTYGFIDEDLDIPYRTVDLPGPEVRSLRAILDHLQETYCRSIGVEVRHIEDTDERRWLQERMEGCHNRLTLGREQQIRLLTKLSDAENLEQFIHKSYSPGTKRFSLEGAESLIPLLDTIIERGAEHGVDEIVFGMAHRGRINVIVNILETSLRDIFYAFEDKDAERFLGRGDVKYHLGYSTDRLTSSGHKVHLTLTFNPSHLEFACPVVEGRVRAKQERFGDTERRRIVPLLIHGDAAFVGQGVVAETLNLGGLGGYRTGGTIHVIVNNQVGFTTDPEDSRSTRYASDLILMLRAPVFHVNGEDPEAVAQVALLAVEYRQRFGKDVLIDLYCYRRHGHNEGDEPRFTQPRMYALIDKKPTVRAMYVRRLVELGQVSAETAEDIGVRRRAALAEALSLAKKHGSCPAPDWMGGVWTGYRGGPEKNTPDVETAVPRERLLALAASLATLPEGFQAHPKIRALLEQRHQRVRKGELFDWGTAETLAYASLLAEGTPIRLSGQDVCRGTFSHRHAVVWDMATGATHAPLATVTATPKNGDVRARFECVNSPLSEAGVLGFECGYAMDFPEALVIWEAQFGDFLNAAQVIVDQFLTSSEDKWQRLCGMVLYLPHGYEGQGPEHSSARVERFVQNTAEDNIQVCNLTTPAQLFHALRRQVLRRWRKPLVIFTPKSLLRASAAEQGPKPMSTLDELATGRFRRVLGDERDPRGVKKVLLCSGKVYYDLARARDAGGRDDIAVVRLEQLYPLDDELPAALAAYAPGTPVWWVQEEPWNYGAWYYVRANLPEALGDRLPLRGCVARERSASPATGSHASHRLEQERLVAEALAK
ncbi:MAG: 2-oxoglutarate dehydrogenase E1 component [Myxococcales bacterium]|nr:2-oxoglutarate dehydrogenase E1 component [Myxococcales bacterium]